jgi:hypothetical protein
MENTIQFNHNYDRGRTYAVDVNFNKEDLLECIHGFDHPVAIKVGIAYLNPKDKFYSKKIGREVSVKDLKVYQFKLSYIENDGDKNFICFASQDTRFSIKFRVFKYSEKPHLLCVYDYTTQ